jgi:hypothetical protein
MSEDYFDVVFLNEETAILHGRTAEGVNFYRELTEDESDKICALERRYSCERDQLLRHFAEESA